MRIFFLFVWFVFSGCVYAEADKNAPTRQVDATSEPEVTAAAPVRKWYAGGGVGFASLTGRDTTAMNAISDNYYGSHGYYPYLPMAHGFFWAVFTDGIQNAFNDVALEGKIYGGYRLLDFLEVELGYTADDSWDYKNNYQNPKTGYTINSSRKIKASALYVSTSIRPLPEGYGHCLYFKLGGHSSELNISKTVSGTQPNLSTIASGDRLPWDGVSSGYGSLFGLGVDIRAGRFGAVRLEWSHYNKLGGTPYGKSSLDVGYHADF